MRNTRKLNIGIIGTGWPGQQHAIALRTSKRGQLYACADVDEQRRAAFARDFECRKCFADYHELLLDKKVAAVAVCLPNFLHFPASQAALAAGKHVFCEKPPALNAAEMRVLRDEAKARRRIYFFGRQFRFTPGMRAAKQLIADGRLGTIYFARAIWVRSRGIPPGMGGWFTDKKRSGGGALIDIGVHALDSVWYLMGTPKPTSVSAGVFRNFAHFVQADVFDVEDAAYGFIRFDNGSVVQLETSWAGNLPDDIPEGKYFGRESNNSIVYGTRGTIRLKPLTLFENQNGALVTVPIPNGSTDDNAASFSAQFEDFLGAIRGENEPTNNADQAVALMEMIDAIYASGELKREIPMG